MLSHGGIITIKKFQNHKKNKSGSFGEIFQAINILNNEYLAIKVEKKSIKHPKLLFEAKLYTYLHKDYYTLDKGIPKVYLYTTEGDFNLMVMDLLGPSLEQLLVFCGYRFSIKTVLMIADQVLTRIQYLHSKHFLHRDLKPDNLLIGLGKKAHKVFLIDLGLAKKFSQNGVHLPWKENKDLVGTARFASLNTHLGYEQSRRDDLESLGYLLIYFLKGCLPWQNVSAQDKKEKYEKIKDIKMKTTVKELCDGLPYEFELYLQYCRELNFDQEPNYDYLKGLFKKVFIVNNFDFDFIYDWNLPIFAKKSCSYSWIDWLEEEKTCSGDKK